MSSKTSIHAMKPDHARPEFWVKHCDALLNYYGNRLTPNYREKLERMKLESVAEVQNSRKEDIIPIRNPFQ